MQKTLKDVVDSASETAAKTAFLYLSIECAQPWCGGIRARVQETDEISIGRGETRELQHSEMANGQKRLRVDVADSWMSSRHARLERRDGRWTIYDEGSSNGTIVNGERVEHATIVEGSVIALGRTIFVFREHDLRSCQGVGDLCAEELRNVLPGLRTLNPLLSSQFDRLIKFAGSNIDILVLGETGTGKELIARAVHAASHRTGDFVPVNCGALTESLLESQLFGYEKGAFSGATENRPGLVRAAENGTLFLDEIGDLPSPSQAAFLRVLQEREVTPVGATRPIKVDARLVAATHRPLTEMVEQQSFRADLLARIRGFEVTLPPLRNRMEDLGTIVASLIDRTASAQGVTFSLGAGMMLLNYEWPHNIRELAKCIDVSAMIADGAVIRVEHLPVHMSTGQAAKDSAGTVASAGGRAQFLKEEDSERRRVITALLQEHAGNVSAVAREMGKARNQIQRWMKRFDIAPHEYRG